MTSKLEQVDLLRKRANVGYEEAKAALERCDGDIVEALILLEKDNKMKIENKPKSCSKFVSGVKNVIRKGNRTKFIIRGKNSDLLNLPLTVAVIITIVATPVVVIGVPAALLTNHRIKIEKENGEDTEVNKLFDKMSSAVNSVTEKLCADDNSNSTTQEQN